MSKINLRIGFVTSSDPMDKRSWSGTHYRMYKALSEKFETVIPTGPIEPPLWVRMYNRMLYFLHLIFLDGKYNLWYNTCNSKLFAKSITNTIKDKNLDVLFAPAASVEIAMLNTDIPICYFSDSSFEQLKDYYYSFSNLSKRSCKESNKLESSALSKSKIAVFSSKWASDFVVDYYKIEKSSIAIVPLGANLDNAPKIQQRDYDGKIKILFLGLDWNRKGGDIVLETFKLLEAKGYNVELYIVGCTPNTKIESNNITVIPFLDKNIKEDNDRFLEIMNNTHLLFVPTRADCTPIVFCEANAFGIPVITSETGGVSSIIENEVTGIILPYNASPEEYESKLAQLIKDTILIEKMSLKAREKFDKVLNWDSWADEITNILKKCVESKL